MDQLRSLRVFTQVIAEGSFAGAARVLDMAPAVVTRAIADLEQHLGARLLNRTTRSLALTDVGEAYLARAQRLLADLEDADACAGSDTKTPRGTLRVLCPPAFATHQLAKHLPRFRARYPQITLELTTPGPVSAADENFDISILSIGQQPLAGDFVVRTLVCSSFIVCAAPQYLAQRGCPETPADLRQHEALLPAVNALRRDLTLFRQVPDVTAGAVNVVTVPLHPPALLTSQLELILAAAVAGLGIAGLPSFMTEEALRDGRLQRVLPQWRGTTLTLYAAMPTRKHVPARTREVVFSRNRSIRTGIVRPACSASQCFRTNPNRVGPLTTGSRTPPCAYLHCTVEAALLVGHFKTLQSVIRGVLSGLRNQLLPLGVVGNVGG